VDAFRILTELADNPSFPPAHVDLLLATGRHEILLAVVGAGTLAPHRVPTGDPWALLAGLRRRDAPPEWATRLAAWPDVEVRRALGEYAESHERLDIADLVAGDEDCAVVAGAAGVPAFPGDLMQRLVARTEACIRAVLARNPHVAPTLLVDLLGGRLETTPCPHAHVSKVRANAAANESTPLEAVLPWCAAPDPELALILAHRRDLPADVYERFAESGSREVRSGVASNPAAPADLLRRLYDSGDARDRSAVLSNGRTPLDVLVRNSRAGGAQCTGFHSTEALRPLAEDPDPLVRLVAADGYVLNGAPADALVADEDDRVAHHAMLRWGMSEAGIRAFVARHGIVPLVVAKRNCPPDLLLAAALDPASPPAVLDETAANPHSPVAALEACHRRPHTAQALAFNPSTPPAILRDLADHEDPVVLELLASNTSLPAEAALRIVRRLTG
jgi:hypothetical protein